MSPSVQILLSGAMSFGIPLALAARELVVLRRRGSGSWRPDGPTPPPPPKPLSWQPSLPPARLGTRLTDPGARRASRERELA